uniref:Uncharacterized protein n=1 Tax=Arundo donax TaxID=35708 RepID=A0A0A9GRY0_ARUDO
MLSVSSDGTTAAVQRGIFR